MSSEKKTDKKCVCGQPVENKCAKCKKMVCDDCNCGTETVDGFLCGTYTEWGCARKYTTCDECLDDKAIHEEDMNNCEECGNTMCDECLKTHDCS